MSHRHFCDFAGHYWECEGIALRSLTGDRVALRGVPDVVEKPPMTLQIVTSTPILNQATNQILSQITASLRSSTCADGPHAIAELLPTSREA